MGADGAASQLVQIKVVLLTPVSLLPLGALAHGISERNGKSLKDAHVFKIYLVILEVPFANMLCR